MSVNINGLLNIFAKYTKPLLFCLVTFNIFLKYRHNPVCDVCKQIFHLIRIKTTIFHQVFASEEIPVQWHAACLIITWDCIKSSLIFLHIQNLDNFSRHRFTTRYYTNVFLNFIEIFRKLVNAHVIFKIERDIRRNITSFLQLKHLL